MCDEHESILRNCLENWQLWEDRAKKLERQLLEQAEYYAQRGISMAQEIEWLRERLRSAGAM